MVDQVELKPCPFCGGTAISKTDNGHEEWLQCSKCGAGGPWIDPPEDHEFTGNELAEQWNTRSAYNPVEVDQVEKVARVLYEREAARSAFADDVIAAARGKPLGNSSMEPWSECAAMYLEDAEAVLTAYNPNERLREALEACRDKFREYEGLHTLKLRDYKGKEPLNYAAELQFKINRNREMAELCDAVLTPPSDLSE